MTERTHHLPHHIKNIGCPYKNNRLGGCYTSSLTFPGGSCSKAWRQGRRCCSVHLLIESLSYDSHTHIHLHTNKHALSKAQITQNLSRTRPSKHAKTSMSAPASSPKLPKKHACIHLSICLSVCVLSEYSMGWPMEDSGRVPKVLTTSVRPLSDQPSNRDQSNQSNNRQAQLKLYYIQTLSSTLQVMTKFYQNLQRKTQSKPLFCFRFQFKNLTQATDAREPFLPFCSERQSRGWRERQATLNQTQFIFIQPNCIFKK